MKNLNQKERTIIAEFVFSNQTDVLIKSDVIKLIELFFNHKIITDEVRMILVKEVNANKSGVISEINGLLSDNIPEEQGKQIMSEYYGGN